MRKETEAGIDVSKDVLDVAVRRDRQRLETARFANDPAGHQALARWLTKRGTYVAGKTQTKRVTMTAAVTITASAISVPVDVPESESRIGRSWSPTSPNRRAFSRNVRMLQTASPWRRVSTVVNSGVYQPT